MSTHIITVVFGCLSAVLWIGSSVVPMPRQVWIVARVGGGGPSDDVDLLVSRLRTPITVERRGGAVRGCCDDRADRGGLFVVSLLRLGADAA